MPAPPIAAHLSHAQHALSFTQRELAEFLGVSVRTLARIHGGQSVLDPKTVLKLATEVYRADRELAAQILGTIQLTLVSAGLEAPPAAPPVAPPAPAPVRARPSAAALRPLLDAVVCAVADAADVAPKVVRPSVLLTLRTVAAVGLDLEAAGDAGLLDGAAADATQA